MYMQQVMSIHAYFNKPKVALGALLFYQIKIPMLQSAILLSVPLFTDVL
jgi:hypothetical protein